MNKKQIEKICAVPESGVKIILLLDLITEILDYPLK